MMMQPPRRGFEPQRFKGDFNRTKLLELCDMTVEAFDSLRRRGQVPLLPTLDNLVLTRTGVPVPDNFPEYDARGWSPLMALALIIANDLVEQYAMSRDLAAHIARHVYLIGYRGREIAESSTKLAETKSPSEIEHIVLARVMDAPGIEPTMAKGKLDPTIMIGTVAEIAAKHPLASGMVAVSVTAAVAKMRRRAERAKVDLSDFVNSLARRG